MIPKRKYFDLNRSTSSSAGFPSRLRFLQPPGEEAEAADADREQRADRAAALLPDEDPEHDAAHPERRQDRADDVDAAVSGVRRVVHAPACRGARTR